MSSNNFLSADQKLPNSILSFSGQITTGYRMFSKEDFLHMMSEMSLEEIKLDLESFKNLEEYEICKKIEYVIEVKQNAEKLSVNIVTVDVNI